MGCQQAEVADDGNKHHSEPEVCWFTACYGRRRPFWSIGCPWPRWEKLSWSICVKIEIEWRENLTIVGNITYTFQSVFSVCLLFFYLFIFWKQFFSLLTEYIGEMKEEEPVCTSPIREQWFLLKPIGKQARLWDCVTFLHQSLPRHGGTRELRNWLWKVLRSLCALVSF